MKKKAFGTSNARLITISMAKDQKRVASINLRDDGYDALITLQKRTGLSRKDVISNALVESLNKSLAAPIVKFKLTEPLFLLELRRDVVSLEAAAKSLRFRIHSEKHKDPTQLPVLVLELQKLKAVVEGLQVLETVIRTKNGLLEGLNASDYEGLKKLPAWCASMRKTAQSATPTDKAKRLARYDLIERIALLLT